MINPKIITAVWAGLAATSSAFASHLLFEETFESTYPFNQSYKESVGPHSLQYVSTPVYEGARAARFELRDSDPMVNSGTRSEVLISGSATNSLRWYSFAVYFPSDGFPRDSSAEIISQWHQHPDTHLGEPWGNPPIAFITQNDQLLLNVRFDTAPLTTSPRPSKILPLGEVPKNTWVRFTFRIVHSYGTDGLIEVWRDGTRIVTHQGGNMFNNVKLPHFKVGIYKWDWNGSGTTETNRRVVYFDNVRVGNEYATLSDMGESAPAPTSSPLPSPSSLPSPSPTPSSPLRVPGNLVLNSGFESGLTSWTSDWGNSLLVTSGAYSGSQAIRIGTGDGGRAQPLALTGVAGMTFTLKAAGRLTLSGETAYIGVNFLAGNQKVASDASLSFTGTSYEMKSRTFTVPTGVESLRVFVWKGASAGYFFADDVSLVATGSSPSPSPSPSISPQPSPTPSPQPSVSSTPPPVSSVELIQNGGFEKRLTGWVNWGNSTTVRRSTSSGFKALRVGTRAGGVGQNLSVSSAVGREFELRVKGQMSHPSEAAWVGVSFLTASGGKVAPDLNIEISGQTYQQKSQSFTVPSGVARLRVFVWKEASSGYLYVDDLSLKEIR